VNMAGQKKYLITGAAGFIGSTLSEKLLKNGCLIRGVDCFSDYYPREIKEKNIKEALKNSSYEFIEADLAEADLNGLTDGVDYVVHLAAQPGVRKSWGDHFQVYIDNNIKSTQKLLESLVNKPIRKLVYASSSSVYGDSPSLPMRENSYIQPVSPYGVTKLAAENLVHLYQQAFGIPSVSLRLFTVYGPRQRPDMAFNKFMRRILNGGEIEIFGDGEQTRDFTYVDDVVSAFISAAEKGVEGRIYNIGGGHRISINDLIKKLREITGMEVKVRHIPSQQGEMKHTYADYNSASGDFGYSPDYNLDNGLKNEWEWLKNEN
jgi:nucleoside-diphosphate-sugar epimerase